MNDAVQFIKTRLTAPVPPNANMSAEEIAHQQAEIAERERLRQKKKKEEEDSSDSEYRRDTEPEEDMEEQTPTPKSEREPEPQEKAPNRFRMKVKDVINRVDDVIDETADALEERAGIAYQNAKAGTKKFLNDERLEFKKATQQRSTPQRKRTYKPLVSESDKARSADFAVRDYERRRQPRQYSAQNIISERGYQAVEDIRTNPYIGFNDVNGYGELSRDAFSLSTSQFNFSLIGDSSPFGGEQQAKNQFSISFGGSFLPRVDSGFGGGVYRGEFDAFKRKPKNPHKRKNIKRKKSSRDFDISRLIF